MTRKRLLILAAIVAVPAIAIGVWLTAPLFFDDPIDEEFPMSAGAVVPDDMTQEEVEAEMEEAAAAPEQPAEEPMPENDNPVVLLTGQFVGADDFHMGQGRATVYELEDGSEVLRFEAFEVTNGPDLHVLLVPDDAPTGRDDLDGYVDLGSLKGNVGNQNYEIPPEVDIADFGSVVIYCQPFHVLFASATLS